MVAGLLVGTALSVGLIGTVIGCNIDQLTQNQYSRTKMSKLNKYLNYSFLGDMDQQKIIDSIYAGYVSGLEDPSTAYLNAEEYKAERILEKGRYIGTGIFFTWGISGNEIVVTEVLEESPAQKAGIKVGDKIVKIDDISVRMANQVGLYEKLGYTGDKEVVYTLQDNDGSHTREVGLVSTAIAVPAIDGEILEGNIGYVEMRTVTSKTSEALQNKLEVFKKKRVKGVILDIRNLSSRNFEEILQLCDLFIEDELIFKVQDKAGTMKEYRANPGVSYEGKVILIANEGTSGVIEAFISALNEIKKTPIIGGTTGGEGVITQTIDLGDKTGVRVTTGILYNKAGVALKGKGISPTVPVKATVESAVEIMTTGKLSIKNDAPLVEAIKQLK